MHKISPRWSLSYRTLAEKALWLPYTRLCFFFFLQQVKGSFYFLYFQSFQRVARVEPEQPVSFLLSSTPIFVVEDCAADAQPQSRNPSRYWWKLGAIFRRHSNFYGREDSIFGLQGQFWKQFLYYFPSTLTPFCRKRYCKMVVFVMHSMSFWWQARSFQPKCYPRAFALQKHLPSLLNVVATKVF